MIKKAEYWKELFLENGTILITDNINIVPKKNILRARVVVEKQKDYFRILKDEIGFFRLG